MTTDPLTDAFINPRPLTPAGLAECRAELSAEIPENTTMLDYVRVLGAGRRLLVEVDRCAAERAVDAENRLKPMACGHLRACLVALAGECEPKPGDAYCTICASAEAFTAEIARLRQDDAVHRAALRGERLISADDVHEARLAGWRAGREAAAQTCATFAQRAGGDIAEGAAVCEESIRAILDPPSQEKAK